MKEPWSFGILFLCITFLFMWNYYAPFIPIIGPTNTTIATMVGEGRQWGPRGMKSIQLGVLHYWVEDSLCTKVQRLDARRGRLTIGSKMTIEYAVNDPEDIRVKQYVDVPPPCDPVQFYAVGSGKRTTLRLCGAILFSRTSTLKGLHLDSFAMECTWQGDTLLAFPVGRAGAAPPRTFYFEMGKRLTLTDLRAGIEYRSTAR